MVQYWRPSCSSWTESVWSSFGRTIMGKAVWENPVKARLGENSKLGMSLCSSWKRITLICVHNIGWKETKLWSDVKLLNQEVDLGEPTSFLDHVFLGCTQRQCEKKKRHSWQFQNHDEFPREELKCNHPRKIFVFHHGLMIWSVMQRSVWSDILS